MCMCLVCGVGRGPPAGHGGPGRLAAAPQCAQCADREERAPPINPHHKTKRVFYARRPPRRNKKVPSAVCSSYPATPRTCPPQAAGGGRETRARQRETVQQCKFSYGSVRPGSVHCGARRRERPDWRRRASLRLAALRRPRGACRACQSANASTRPPAGRGGRVAVTPLHRWLRASSDCPVTFVCSGEWLGAWWAMSQRRFCRRARCEAASWMAAAARSSA